MDAALVGTLQRIVSEPRLRRYRDAASSDRETVILYCWNIQLAEALIPSLAMLEVPLRNAAHRTLTEYAGTDYWFRSVLHRQMYGNITDLIGRIVTRQGQLPTADKVISEITFGFWPLLFSRSYNALWWKYPEPLLAQVLPHHPNIARDTRSAFEQRLEYFARLRNRAMHQEAVFQGVAALNRPVLPVNTLHRHLVETIGWIDADAVKLVECLDHFTETFQVGKRAIERELLRRFTL